MRKKKQGHFELRSDLGTRSRISRGDTVPHKVTVFNYASFDVVTGFVSRCRDEAIAYAHGEEWEPLPARLEASEWRLRAENSFEFAEDLTASGSARKGQMTQVTITPWRRRIAPTQMIEMPLALPVGEIVHNVRIG